MEISTFTMLLSDKEIRAAIELKDKKLYFKYPNKQIYFFKKNMNEVPTLKECEAFLTFKEVKTTNQIDDMYKDLIMVKEVGDNIVCFCSNGFKQGKCIHKFTIEYLTKKFKVDLLISTGKGRKRKFVGSLLNQEEIDKKKEDKKHKFT